MCVQTGEVIRMAVPSSYNDVTQDKSLRDHIGWVWLVIIIKHHNKANEDKKYTAVFRAKF